MAENTLKNGASRPQMDLSKAIVSGVEEAKRLRGQLQTLSHQANEILTYIEKVPVNSWEYQALMKHFSPIEAQMSTIESQLKATESLISEKSKLLVNQIHIEANLNRGKPWSEPQVREATTGSVINGEASQSLWSRTSSKTPDKPMTHPEKNSPHELNVKPIERETPTDLFKKIESKTPVIAGSEMWTMAREYLTIEKTLENFQRSAKFIRDASRYVIQHEKEIMALSDYQRNAFIWSFNTVWENTARIASKLDRLESEALQTIIQTDLIQAFRILNPEKINNIPERFLQTYKL